MTTSKTSKWASAAAIAVSGLASATLSAFSQIGPKNLVSPTYRAPAVQSAVREALTDKQAKRLAATAQTRTDHFILADFYTAKADGLEVQARRTKRRQPQSAVALRPR